MEEALKMRNLLEEFNEDHGVRPPSILGVREHIFTGRLFLLYILNFIHWFVTFAYCNPNYFDSYYIGIAVFLHWRGLCQIKK